MTINELTIEELNERVTAAILRAETFDLTPEDRASAYEQVSQLEEALASKLSPHKLDGAIARVGACTAALSAGQPGRSRELARKYIREMTIDSSVSDRLLALFEEAIRRDGERR